MSARSQEDLENVPIDIKEDLGERQQAARQQFSYQDAKRLKRKADIRILPLLMLGYLV